MSEETTGTADQVRSAMDSEIRVLRAENERQRVEIERLGASGVRWQKHLVAEYKTAEHWKDRAETAEALADRVSGGLRTVLDNLYLVQSHGDGFSDIADAARKTLGAHGIDLGDQVRAAEVQIESQRVEIERLKEAVRVEQDHQHQRGHDDVMQKLADFRQELVDEHQTELQQAQARIEELERELAAANLALAKTDEILKPEL